MSHPVITNPTQKLVQLGLLSSANLNYQLSPEELIQDTLRNGQGRLSDTGALVVHTGQFTGRSPKDKFIVMDKLTADTIDWNEFNNPIGEKHYQLIYDSFINHFNNRKELWVRDAYACAEPSLRLNIRVIAENPWTSLFCYNMFLHPDEEALENFKPAWHILTAPELSLDPKTHGTRQQNGTIVNFKTRTILIAGSGYTGEIKKAVFSVLNYLLPSSGVLSMHCAANRGSNGDTAIYFGLSGTGKTTLSADPARQLIGDDEHGWDANSIFNFEGGCYAKTIDLKKEKEPQIYNAVRAGALVENVGFFPKSNEIDFADRSITENTRVSYPLDFIAHALHPSIGAVPDNIFFLTCDACGVLPPISKLSTEQAMYQFISGYTAKIAGTETGVTAPKPTFSACFGAPFLPLHPGRYAELLGEKIRSHKVSIWLVNTGWTGGPVGKGKRIPLQYTRAMIAAALNGSLHGVRFEKDPVFGMAVPVTCPGVPSAMLWPANTWQDGNEYELEAKKLAALFILNFKKYESGLGAEICQAGPRV